MKCISLHHFLNVSLTLVEIDPFNLNLIYLFSFFQSCKLSDLIFSDSLAVKSDYTNNTLLYTLGTRYYCFEIYHLI